jgi:hypothetical protein
MEEGTLSEGLSACGAWHCGLSVGGVERICLNVPESRKQSAPPRPRRSQLGSPLTALARKTETGRGVEGTRRKEERSGGALGSEAAIDRPWHPAS